MNRGGWLMVGLVAVAGGWLWFGGGRALLQTASIPVLDRSPEVVHDRDGRAWFRARGDDQEQRAIEACFALENRELYTTQATNEGLKFCCRPRQGEGCDRPKQPVLPPAPPPPPPPPQLAYEGRVRFVDKDGKPIPPERALEALDTRAARIEFEQWGRIAAIDPAGKRTTLGSEQYNRAMIEGYAIEINGLFCRLKSAPRPVAHSMRRVTSQFECW